MPHKRPSIRKIEWPSYAELMERIEATSKSAVARELGVSHVSVIKHLQREEQRIREGYTGPRTSCRRCGVVFTDENRYTTSSVGKVYCKACFNWMRNEAFKDRKQQAIEHLGGECVRCGYDRYYGALHIHHVDPAKKSPTFRRHKGWSWARLEKELENCELLCANCHAEEHQQ